MAQNTDIEVSRKLLVEVYSQPRLQRMFVLFVVLVCAQLGAGIYGVTHLDSFGPADWSIAYVASTLAGLAVLASVFVRGGKTRWIAMSGLAVIFAFTFALVLTRAMVAERNVMLLDGYVPYIMGWSALPILISFVVLPLRYAFTAACFYSGFLMVSSLVYLVNFSAHIQNPIATVFLLIQLWIVHPQVILLLLAGHRILQEGFKNECREKLAPASQRGTQAQRNLRVVSELSDEQELWLGLRQVMIDHAMQPERPLLLAVMAVDDLDGLLDALGEVEFRLFYKRIALHVAQSWLDETQVGVDYKRHFLAYAQVRDEDEAERAIRGVHKRLAEITHWRELGVTLSTSGVLVRSGESIDACILRVNEQLVDARRRTVGSCVFSAE